MKENGILYIGNWKNGKREGRGYNLFINPEKGKGYYIGEWADDLPNGEAKMHIETTKGNVKEYVGIARNGYAEGLFQKILLGDGNILGYEYYCKQGIPQSLGVGMVNYGELEETIMALLIDENSEKMPVWHTWAGLRCSACNEESYDDMFDFLNAFDHSWAGWGDDVAEFSFIVD